MGQCPSEFDLIERYFSLGVPSKWPSQGIGDDCAIISIGTSKIAVTTDTLAIGTHFLPDVDPFTVGYKALAVNLSDLAAAAAVPRAFFLRYLWIRPMRHGLSVLRPDLKNVLNSMGVHFSEETPLAQVLSAKSAHR